MPSENHPPKYKSIICKPDEMDHCLNKAAKDGWVLLFCFPTTLGRVYALLIDEKK